jgi:hypothetical protein
MPATKEPVARACETTTARGRGDPYAVAPAPETLAAAQKDLAATTASLNSGSRDLLVDFLALEYIVDPRRRRAGDVEEIDVTREGVQLVHDARHHLAHMRREIRHDLEHLQKDLS